MQLLKSLLPNFGDIFYLAYLFVFQYYGWVLFVIGFIVMFWREYVEEIQGQFVRSTSWVFLQILVPRENRVSTLAVENIFAQMHVLHRNLTLQERFVEGKFQLWYALEIVSLGGKVSFIIRSPKKSQHLVESAFYSQYPTAEIREISDYMENFKLNPYQDDNEYDFFGTEWKMTEDSVIPMKTYKDFEHPAAEEKIIDPLTNLIETMERVKPHEFLSLQILIQPIQNDEWEMRSVKKVKELIGEALPHELSFLRLLLKPFDWFAKFSYKAKIFSLGEGHNSTEDELGRKQKNNWLSMTESEKKRVNLIQEKLNKACYNTKIRLLYIAPKNDYDKGRRFELIGAIRHLSPGGGAGIHNTLKSDMSIWTKVDPYFSPSLEDPVVKWKTNHRKHWFLKGYKARSIYVGSPKFLLSTEELATIFHFPITPEGTLAPAHVESVPSKTVRPPADLPVGEVVEG